MTSQLLHNFTKVYVRYCDGGYYSTDRSDPVAVPARNRATTATATATAAAAAAAIKTIYYRGRSITWALLADLKLKHGLNDATDVVVSGCSAGAIHIYSHLDNLREQHLPNESSQQRTRSWSSRLTVRSAAGARRQGRRRSRAQSLRRL